MEGNEKRVECQARRRCRGGRGPPHLVRRSAERTDARPLRRRRLSRGLPERGLCLRLRRLARQSDGGYLVVREEDGQAPPDVIAGLSTEQRLMMRAQLQCRDSSAQRPGGRFVAALLSLTSALFLF